MCRSFVAALAAAFVNYIAKVSILIIISCRNTSFFAFINAERYLPYLTVM